MQRPLTPARSSTFVPRRSDESQVGSAVVVNDIHSQLNPTPVHRIVAIDSERSLQHAIRRAAAEGLPVCVAGGRHAMGGQQFCGGAVLLDMRTFNRVRHLDAATGTVEVESGIMWPELIAHLVKGQVHAPKPWGIAQKQTGADRLTIGGALAANIHGRGLTMRPLIGDVAAFTLVDARGEAHLCSRRHNRDLFRLAIGGYGLFGVIASVRLRLVPRRKLQRIVELRLVEDLPAAFQQRIDDGFLYGDFQFAIDERSDDFLRRGVFSCYRPVPSSTPIKAGQKELGEDDWRQLLWLAHADKSRAFELYAGYYLSTTGQVYWSDTHQLSTYLDDYHKQIDARARRGETATEVITELYVPRPRLPDFMAAAAAMFRRTGSEVVYGTVRLIERDDESFLAWAREPYACVIFNLHTVHTSEGRERSARTFRSLIDLAIERGGSYYLTYHRHASRRQVEACYPEFPEFLRLKRRYDPDGLFQSDWSRHYTAMFADTL